MLHSGFRLRDVTVGGTVSRMRRPPRSVSLVARTHWVVGSTVLVSAVFLRVLLARWPLEFPPKLYLICGGLALLYLTAGTLVWFGVSPGRILSRICGLLYLARPNLGSYLWNIMDSSEYREHFRGRRRDAGDAGGGKNDGSTELQHPSSSESPGQ